MLTAFKRNTNAIRFYKEKLGLYCQVLSYSHLWNLGFLWIVLLRNFMETKNANMKSFQRNL